MTRIACTEAVIYVEAVDQLLLRAAQAQTLEAKLQFEMLARLYGRLAAVSARYREDSCNHYTTIIVSDDSVRCTHKPPA
jgi:hypothetical protein